MKPHSLHEMLIWPHVVRTGHRIYILTKMQTTHWLNVIPLWGRRSIYRYSWSSLWNKHIWNQSKGFLTNSIVIRQVVFSGNDSARSARCSGNFHCPKYVECGKATESSVSRRGQKFNKLLPDTITWNIKSKQVTDDRTSAEKRAAAAQSWMEGVNTRRCMAALRTLGGPCSQ